MNLDFILFSAPRSKHKFLDFWGQVIFIPSYSTRRKDEQRRQNILSPLTNCYKANKTSEVYFSIQNALTDNQGISTMSEMQGTSNTSHTSEDEQICDYIPCLYLSSMVASKYLMIYFHASGEDIKIAHGFLNFIRNSYQINVLAMEYPGYSFYPGSPSSTLINKNASTVYRYVMKNLGFHEKNIIVSGRSIGTGVALQLLKSRKDTRTPNPRCLVLISPFASVKNLVREFVGKLGTLLAKQTYDNLENISQVKCPVFILHGRKDSLISWTHSQELLKNCYTRKQLLIPDNMTHSAFDYYSDLIDPLRDFLMEDGVNFYEQNMKGPNIPQELFKCPEGFKF